MFPSKPYFISCRWTEFVCTTCTQKLLYEELFPPQSLQCGRCMKHSGRDSSQLSQVFPAEPLRAMHESPNAQKAPMEELLFEWHSMRRSMPCPTELVNLPLSLYLSTTQSI